MSQIEFSLSWEDPGKAKGGELRATWATIKIVVADVNVTCHYDQRLRTERECLVMPAYPLAVWLASCWYHLLYEPHPAALTKRPGFWERHNLLYSEEGYAMPWLSLIPQDTVIEAEWKTWRSKNSHYRFLNEGKAALERAAVAGAITEFISAVVERLDEHDIKGTLLQEEWQAIQTLETSEREFCMAAAMLGQDPFDSSPDAQEFLEGDSRTLPNGALWEFLAVADPANLIEQARSVTGTFDSGDRIAFPSALHAIRAHAPSSGRQYPWEFGYQLANQVHEALGSPDRSGSSVEELYQYLGLVRDQAGADFLPLPPGIDAVLHSSGEEESWAIPSFVTEKARFTVGRALYGNLIKKTDCCRLVTSGRTAEQAASRAFSAQLLCPDWRIKELIPSRFVSTEEVDEIGRLCAVSSWVVRHQITNHQIADILP